MYLLNPGRHALIITLFFSVYNNSKLLWKLINSAAGQSENTCRAQKKKLHQLGKQHRTGLNERKVRKKEIRFFLDVISEQTSYLIWKSIPFLQQIIPVFGYEISSGILWGKSLLVSVIAGSERILGHGDFQLSGVFDIKSCWWLLWNSNDFWQKGMERRHGRLYCTSGVNTSASVWDTESCTAQCKTVYKVTRGVEAGVERWVTHKTFNSGH